MDNLEELKKRAAPQSERLVESVENLIILQVEANEIATENKDINREILSTKVLHHNDWIASAAKRFYVGIVSVMATGAVLYLDVLKLDEESAIVAAALGVFHALIGG